MEEAKEELSALNRLLKRGWLRSQYIVGQLFKGMPKQRLYLYGAIITLGVSTLFWAILGARLQLHNADQLSDPYMFADSKTFHGALFPVAHTFLLKWPIFWLVSVFGVSSVTITSATVAVAMLTVGALAYLLYKLDRRPVVLGTVYFGLAFVMLLIPPQPYAGGLLPVNMAMLTTRNIEYIFYIVGLVLCVRATRIKSVSFASSVIVLGILIASDKLFAALSLGGAGVALVVYAVLKNWRMVTFAVRWLLAGVAAVVLAEVLLTMISSVHLTNLVGGSTASPYAVSTDAKNLLLGVGYSALGLLTNFGANPAYSNRTLADLPHDVLTGVFSLSGVLHLIAIAIMLVSLAGVWYVFRLMFSRKADQNKEPAVSIKLSMALIWSMVAALGVFVATNHYYAVDARYLTIGFFAAAVALMTALRSFTPVRPQRMATIGLLLGIGVIPALISMHGVVRQQAAAFDTVSSRNAVVAQLLRRHHTDVVVGDYWRVLPIKFATEGKTNVMPLVSCTQPNSTLTSKVWQPDLKRHSFAYLITLDGSLTSYPHCSLAQISGVYGRPNSVQVIAGTLANPKEALLFYDQGSHPPIATLPSPAAPAALLPVQLEELAQTTCTQPTIMNAVAHQDDDLLFLNPDLLNDLHSGNCVRTLYMTAGDSGFGKYYWLSRQLGAEAAYSRMLHIQNVWDQQTVALGNGKYATVANPRDNRRVSLIFLNLPDGGLHGDGFPDSGHQSLAKLRSGTLTTIRAVDGQSTYTANDLTATLSLLMNTYQPAEIRTQAEDTSGRYPDHSDHIATSWFVTKASDQYDAQHFGGVVSVPVIHYMGYPVRDHDQNVFDGELQAKRDAFFAYAHYDSGVCSSIERCAHVPTYDAYLSRQYAQP
jgi:hypothetical protein